MAHLTEPTADATTATSTCCEPAQQATCCEPSEKAGCCSAESSTCGCSAGAALGDEVTETHRVHRHAGSAIIGARKPAA